MDSRDIYKVEYSKSVAKYVEKQNSEFKERFEKVVSNLAYNPFNNDGELSGCKDLYKKRFGKFRLLFNIHNNILTITLVKVDSRGQVYKNL